LTNRSELGVESGATTVLAPEVDDGPVVMAISGADMFVSARRDRRVHLPAALRRGRRRARHARTGRRAGNNEGESPQRMHLVDVDGQTETARIALRLRFEDMSVADFPSDVDSAELRQSMAG
jgi:hypothetical protein